MAASSVQEIDELIVKLQQRRQRLLDERARVQREILEYTALSQSTMQSTKIISESLAQLNKVPDAPRVSDTQVQDVPAAEQHSETAAEQSNSAGEPLAQHAANESASSDKAEDAAEPGDRPSETGFAG